MRSLPYETLVPTEVKPSTIQGAGLGLFACVDLEPLTPIGFYPGVYQDRFEPVAHPGYAMGTLDPDVVLVPDPSIRVGLHFVNEPSPEHAINSVYVKLDDLRCLFLSWGPIKAGDELLTCYGHFKHRDYLIPSAHSCADPRCGVHTRWHRKHCRALDDWHLGDAV